jgi:hypothetical protein
MLQAHHPMQSTQEVCLLLQEELAQAAKRKAGNASARKQRSILDFFKTPPSEQGPKRRKVPDSSTHHLTITLFSPTSLQNFEQYGIRQLGFGGRALLSRVCILFLSIGTLAEIGILAGFGNAIHWLPCLEWTSALHAISPTGIELRAAILLI